MTTSSPAADALPLDGIRILDLTRLLPGPFCTMLLGDMGADILKVEDPKGGDYARYYPPFVEAGHGAFFESVNRNKRSIALDLKHPDGPSLLIDLAATCDIVIESFRPGVMAKLGCGPEHLRTLHPHLIVCSITGYGQNGPLAHKAGHDLNFIARSGLLEQNGRSGEPPIVPGFQLADLAGGALWAALAITSALYVRERTGQGRLLDISMTEGALALHAPLHGTWSAQQSAERRGEGMLTGGVPSYGVYVTEDDLFLAVGALEPKFWTRLCDALDLAEYATDGLSRGERGQQVRDALTRVFATKRRDEWVDLLGPLDVCVEPVLSPSEALGQELARARALFFSLGGITGVRTPVTPRHRTHRPAPKHGADSVEIVTRALGEEVAQSALQRGIIM